MSTDNRSGLGARDSGLARGSGLDLVAQATELIAEQLKDAKNPAITSSFQSECVVLTDLLRQVRPDIPVLFLDTYNHFVQTDTRPTDEAYNLNLINLRAPEPRIGRPRAPRRLRRPQGRPAHLVARRPRRVVHGASPRSVPAARTKKISRSNFKRKRDPQGSAAGGVDRARRLACEGPASPQPTNSLHQHAASRARRCRRIRTIRDQAAGRVRSSNVGSISKRNRASRRVLGCRTLRDHTEHLISSPQVSRFKSQCGRSGLIVVARRRRIDVGLRLVQLRLRQLDDRAEPYRVPLLRQIERVRRLRDELIRQIHAPVGRPGLHPGERHVPGHTILQIAERRVSHLCAYAPRRGAPNRPPLKTGTVTLNPAAE